MTTVFDFCFSVDNFLVIIAAAAGSARLFASFSLGTSKENIKDLEYFYVSK